MISIFAILLSSCITPAFAASTATVRDVVTALEKSYSGANDIQASFIQRATIAAVKREEKGAGELLIKKGAGNAMFRFDYTKPRQSIISNGKTVWYYLPENRQVMVMSTSSLFAGGNAIAMSYLTGLGNISRDFSAQFVGNGRDKNGNYVIALTPKRSNPSVAKLELTVSASIVNSFMAGRTPKSSFPIIASVLYDNMGNRTMIEYSNIRVNSGISSSKFSFRPPAGVEVIKR